MLHQYKHIVWDWNGTLLNDPNLCHELLNRMLKSREMPLVELNQYREEFYFPLKGYYQDVGFDFSKEPFEELAKEFIDLYENEKSGCQLQENSVELLEELQERGIRQYLFSAYENKLLHDVLRHHHIKPFFDTIRGVDNLHALGKEDTIVKFLEEKSIKFRECIMVGDTLHDLEIAQSIGLECILVSHGHHSHERLDSEHQHVVRSFSELRSMLVNSSK